MSTNSIADFAQRLEADQRHRISQEAPALLATNSDRYRASVHPGKKYTKVDFEGGRYMVVNATGEIFGIKAYGVIHRGHPHGTLATIEEWDWSGYYARHIGKYEVEAAHA